MTRAPPWKLFEQNERTRTHTCKVHISLKHNLTSCPRHLQNVQVQLNVFGYVFTCYRSSDTSCEEIALNNIIESIPMGLVGVSGCKITCSNNPINDDARCCGEDARDTSISVSLNRAMEKKKRTQCCLPQSSRTSGVATKTTQPKCPHVDEFCNTQSR